MSSSTLNARDEGISKKDELLAILQANFSIDWWISNGGLVFGALYFVGVSPSMIFALSVFIWLRPFIQGALVNFGLIRNTHLDGYWKGRFTAPVMNADGSLPEKKSGGNDVVCFVVGSSQNHPLGVLAPGMDKLGAYFNDMWKDAEENSEKWGFLGKTGNMIESRYGRGNRMLNISYWKSLKDLDNFAQTSKHRVGLEWWNQHQKKFDHIGIFHETFVVPKRCYESIYQNFHPFGMGQTKQLVEGVDGLSYPLVKINTGQYGNMQARMEME